MLQISPVLINLELNRATSQETAVSKVTLSEKGKLHARVATEIVKCVASFLDTDVYIAKGDYEVPAISIMRLMSLAAGRESILNVRAVGPHCNEAVHAVVAILRSCE